jgi:hypothetical protein
MDIDIGNIINLQKETREKDEEEETEVESTTQIRLYEQVVYLLEISERIKSSTSATLFDVVVKYAFIKEKSGRKVMETSILKQKHVILFYEFRDHIDFNDLLFRHLTTPRLLVLHVFMSYRMLLESLLVLEQMNISFSSFSSNNVIFEKKTYVPIITQLEDASISNNNNNTAKEVVNELYGNIIQSIIFAFSLENTILNEIVSMTEREDLLRKMDKLDKWDFVREMKPSNMIAFREELLNY